MRKVRIYDAHMMLYSMLTNLKEWRNACCCTTYYSIPDNMTLISSKPLYFEIILLMGFYKEKHYLQIHLFYFLYLVKLFRTYQEPPFDELHFKLCLYKSVTGWQRQIHRRPKTHQPPRRLTQKHQKHQKQKNSMRLIHSDE